MDSLSLCRAACSDPLIRVRFGGVYASDELPKQRNEYCSFIVNLDKRALPGSHWVAIYFRKNICYYFCSYGSPPSRGGISRFITRNSTIVEYNKNTYQDKDTNTCGLYALYFLYQCARSRPLLTLNPLHPKSNEDFIQKFYTTCLKQKPCCILFTCNQNSQMYTCV